MRLLPNQSWSYNGHTYSVSLWVEGSAVVGMTNVTTKAGVIVLAPEKMLGDYVMHGLSKLGMRKKCNGCSKRKTKLNAAHRKVRKWLDRS